MSQRKYISITLVILIYTCLVTKLLANFQDDLDTSKVQNFIKIVQKRNLLSSPIRREVKRKFSNPCFRDIYEFINSILKKEPWSLKMLDAASKIPSGLLVGNQNDFGMYDECLAIQENKNGSEIRGRHCMYSLGFSSEFKNLKPKLSLCVPSSCNATDVTHLLKLLIFNMTDISNIGINSVKSSCSRVDSLDWTTGSIVALTMIGIFILFLLGCTFFDMLQMKTNFQSNFTTTLSRFSVRRSALQILNTKINPASFPALNGIRFLSMCWVVFGHAYFMRITMTVNQLDALEWYNTWKSLYISLAPFAVDSFFTLSGFLMGYLFLKEMSKGRKFNLLGYYLHRYIRLTPAVGMLLIITIFIAPHLGSGPIWENFEDDHQCNEKWWIFLVYLQNYIKRDVSCLGHLWYLAVDMQLFWFSPIILYPLSKRPKIGLAILAASFIASVVSLATIIAINKYSFDMLKGEAIMNFFRDVYTAPHTRAGPWLVGIFFAHITVSKKIKLNMVTASCGWIFTLACFVYCTMGVSYIQRKNYEYNVAWETFFGSTARSIWGVGLSWIIFASIQGHGGPVTKFLSLTIFLPLGKLSYCVYLLHMLLQYMLTSSARINWYFSDFEMFSNFLSDIILSIVIAFFFSLFFESPILILEKIIFRKEKKETKKEISGHDFNGKERPKGLTILQ